MKRAIKVTVIGFAVLAALLLLIYANHRIHLRKELPLRAPLGKLVEVDGHNMSVYMEGEGEKTLVFLSGGGTCCPILDFKSLASCLSGRYKTAIVEKFGYGFSDVVDTGRDIGSILEDTRAALSAAGSSPPYVLCPHSMSGLEALYWARKYPDEVSAVVGLDMAVPQYYDSMKLNIPMMRLSGWLANIGVTRLIPGISESDAIRHGTLTGHEKEVYRAVFYSRTATSPMLREAEAVKENARKVEDMGAPQVPMLLFLSDGSGGTGFDKQTWRQIPKDYLSQVRDGTYVELDCPHYVHDYEFEAISKHMMDFLEKI